ncbi:ATP-binding protein [Geomonas anaerohicana]|uniref:ATP-binding protein n=1 Tax=Geomonas anaerohicana TaxID=2798583 RepID=A0ABS0YFB9_9BACT|nr:ATP-binding protein [Geomonas anaerohicana]MBJ6750978.1 ATP-binding protein [Geomonas anaerohicana]
MNFVAETRDNSFPHGLLRHELFIGILSSINAYAVRVNLTEAGNPSGSHFSGGRYGKGEVGEFVLIEGQQTLLLGRIVEVRLPEHERRTINQDHSSLPVLDAIGQIQLLGSVAMDDLKVTAGVESYPRLGDRVYAAPHKFIADLPLLMEQNGEERSPVLLALGSVDVAQESKVFIKPEKLFGRHCAILGSTGGGKSWTTSRIIEECLKFNSKMILLDATGEYRGFADTNIVHCHLGDPVEKAANSQSCSLPSTCFTESDFVALFEPSGKVQGPKLRAAIQSLRLARLEPGLAVNGVIVKAFKDKRPFYDAMTKHASQINDTREPIVISKLPEQIVNECVQDYGDPKWKGANEAEIGYCASLLTRINGIITSSAFSCVFQADAEPKLTTKIDEFIAGSENLIRIDVSGIAYEFHAREIIANVIGRYLLNKARERFFKGTPLVLIVDEAHNFLGRHIGSEDYSERLDAFELIAKEGRKYGINICLATQRPRDITEGVLSQMGTLIVHRLTNDRDREVVERACGEIDRSASAFLPNLKPGEAAIIGVDFPIPLTIQIEKPTTRPKSDGANFQKYWAP